MIEVLRHRSRHTSTDYTTSRHVRPKIDAWVERVRVKYTKHTPRYGGSPVQSFHMTVYKGLMHVDFDQVSTMERT